MAEWVASAEAEPVEESMILECRVRIDRDRRGHTAPAGRGRRAIWAMAAVLASLHGSVNARAAAQDDTEVTPRIAAATERGLAWLSEKQLPSGGWAADVGYKLRQDYQIRESGTEHVGVTALAGMAFLAGGNLPDRGPYGDELARAVDYLLSNFF